MNRKHGIPSVKKTRLSAGLLLLWFITVLLLTFRISLLWQVRRAGVVLPLFLSRTFRTRLKSGPLIFEPFRQHLCERLILIFRTLFAAFPDGRPVFRNVSSEPENAERQLFIHNSLPCLSNVCRCTVHSKVWKKRVYYSKKQMLKISK